MTLPSVGTSRYNGTHSGLALLVNDHSSAKSASFLDHSASLSSIVGQRKKCKDFFTSRAAEPTTVSQSEDGGKNLQSHGHFFTSSISSPGLNGICAAPPPSPPFP